MIDKRTISIIKAVSWRLIASTTTILISLRVTGHIMLALHIGALELILKIALYYIHERSWLMLTANHQNKKITKLTIS